MVGFGYRSQQTGMAGLVPARRNAAAEARAQRTHDATTERNRNAGRPRKPDRRTGFYLWQGNKDTLYRIHGTNEPWTIGQNVSSGCIRLTNDDITDLYNSHPNRHEGCRARHRRSNCLDAIASTPDARMQSASHCCAR